MRQFWTPEKVLSSIRKMFESGLPLTYVGVRDNDESLLNASTRYFESWRNAVQKAGFLPQYVHKYITEQNVLDEILQRHQSNQSLKTINIQKENQALYVAATKKFGSWLKTVQKIGLTPKDIDYQFKTKWTKEKIKETVQSLDCELNSSTIQKKYYSLYFHAVKEFGSWDKTLIASGLDPLKIKKNGFWTKEYAIQQILERYKKGKSIQGKDVETTFLYSKAREYFGTWTKALEHLGLKVKQRQNYLGEDILCRILRLFFPETQFWTHKKFDWLRSRSNHRMHLDVFSNQLNLGAEFQGPHHFLPIYGTKQFKRQKENDELKITLCRKHRIFLIHIRYNELGSQEISCQLKKLKIKHRFCPDLDYMCELYSQNKFKKVRTCHVAACG